MKKITIDKINEVYCKVNSDIEFAHNFKSKVSWHIKNYKFHPKVKMRVWDGKICMFDTSTRQLPLGLLPILEECVKDSYEIEYNFDVNKKINDISDDEIEAFYKKLFKDPKFYPRDYQEEAIKLGIKAKRGVLEMATGSGKSIICYILYRYLFENVDNKLLLVVPSINLVNQMFSDFKEYGWEDAEKYVTLVHGKSKYDAKKKIVISTWQSLIKRDDEFFEQFDGIIVDEVHGTSQQGASLRTVLSKCVNASYRYGLTGTMPDEKLDYHTITGLIGDVLLTVSSKELIDKGVLSDIKIINTLIRYTDEEIAKVDKMNYVEEVNYVLSHPKRNNILGFIINGLKETENNLVLCEKIKHLDSIVSYLSERFPERKVVKIYGKVSGDIREDIRKDANDEEGTIIVGTFATLSTGWNLPRLHNVFFMSSYKSKFKVIQSIGRGIRKHPSKSKMILFDIVDDFRRKTRTGKTVYNHLFEHFLHRLAMYKSNEFDYVNKTLKIDDIGG